MDAARSNAGAPLAGRVEMVTGAGRGIGRALGTWRRAKPTLAGRFCSGPTTRRTSCASFRVKAAPIAMDVTNEQAVTAGCAQALAALARSRSSSTTPADVRRPACLPIGDLQRMLSEHVVGSALVACALIPGMRELGFGRIVNVSSVIGLVGLQRRTPYSTAKAAIAGLTRGRALQNGRYGITVNAVAPLRADRRAEAEDARRHARRRALRTALGGRALGRPSEIARVVGFLADPASGFITGAVWPADGSYSTNGNPGERGGRSLRWTAARR